MKKLLFTFLLFSLQLYAQNDTNLYIDYNIVSIDIGVSLTTNSNFGWFNINRNGTQSGWDTYEFSFVKNTDPKKYRYNDLGFILETDNALDVKDRSFLSDNDFCINHKQLSNKKILFVKVLSPENKRYRYKIWEALYDGTQMNTLPSSSYSMEQMMDDKFRKM